MIEVEHLQKRFGDIVAVADVSFVARDGEVTGLLGPNGAGKTTSMRMLSTLVQPDGGTARVDGLDLRHEAAALRRRLGILPDARGLYPRLTAREHVRYFGELHGLSGAALDARIATLVKRLGLEDIADRRVQGFSQGERTKVAIARALVHDPKNVLLDEPTNGLDVMSTRAMRDIVRLLKEEGRCVLYTSHVMQEVAALCDRIVIIARGTVVAEGTPEELREGAGGGDLEEAFVDIVSRAGTLPERASASGEQRAASSKAQDA